LASRRPVRQAFPVLVCALVVACGGGPAGGVPGSPAASDLHALLVRAVSDTISATPRHVISSTELAGSGTRHVQTVEGHLGTVTNAWTTVLVSDGTRSEARTIGPASWFTSRAPRFTAALPAGATWIRLVPDDLIVLGVPRPVDQLSLLYVLFGSRNEMDHGAQLMDGIRVKHITAVIDPDRAVCDTPATARNTVAEVVRHTAPGAPTITADVWIDSFRLIRRLAVNLTLGGNVTATYRLGVPSDNAPAEVAPPSDSSQIPLAEAPGFTRFIPKSTPLPVTCS